MSSLIRSRTPLGNSNIPRSTSTGRKSAFEGVVKAVTARKVSMSRKYLDRVLARSENDDSPSQTVSDESPPPADALEQSEMKLEQSLSLRMAQLSVALDNSHSTGVNDRPAPEQRGSTSDGTMSQEVIYSTSSTIKPSNEDISPLGNISLIPSSGLSEEEELQVVGPPTFFEEDESDEDDDTPCIQWAAPLPTHVFLSEPSKSRVKIESIIKLNEGGESIQDTPHTVRRKPVPIDHPSLMSISRKALLSKLTATRPNTPSLLSFTSDTPSEDRRRQFYERPRKTRNATPDSDMLRKSCVERRRLVRAGLLSESSSDSSSSSSPQYFLYPRAGDLRALRSEESTACLEDYYLSYVDLSFIRKTLFAFDMRMRTGSDLWADEMEEIHRYFGRDSEWEVDWDTRWKVAAWLLHQYDDDEEEGVEGEDEREL